LEVSVEVVLSHHLCVPVPKPAIKSNDDSWVGLGKQWGLLDNEYKGADSCLNDSGNNRKNHWLMQDLKLFMCPFSSVTANTISLEES